MSGMIKLIKLKSLDYRCS